MNTCPLVVWWTTQTPNFRFFLACMARFSLSVLQIRFFFSLSCLHTLLWEEGDDDFDEDEKCQLDWDVAMFDCGRSPVLIISLQWTNVTCQARMVSMELVFSWFEPSHNCVWIDKMWFGTFTHLCQTLQTLKMSRTLSHHNEKNSASCSSSGWHKSWHVFLMVGTVMWNPRSTREVNEWLTTSVFGTFVLCLKAQFSFEVFLEIETWILDESEMHNCFGVKFQNISQTKIDLHKWTTHKTPNNKKPNKTKSKIQWNLNSIGFTFEIQTKSCNTFFGFCFKEAQGWFWCSQSKMQQRQLDAIDLENSFESCCCTFRKGISIVVKCWLLRTQNRTRMARILFMMVFSTTGWKWTHERGFLNFTNWHRRSGWTKSWQHSTVTSKRKKRKEVLLERRESFPFKILSWKARELLIAHCVILSRHCKVLSTTTALAFPFFLLFLIADKEGFLWYFWLWASKQTLNFFDRHFRLVWSEFFCHQKQIWCRILFSICNFDFGPNFCQISNTKQNTNSHFNFFCWLCFVFFSQAIKFQVLILCCRCQKSQIWKNFILDGLLLQTTKQIEFEFHFQQNKNKTTTTTKINQTTQNNNQQQPTTICTITNKQHKTKQKGFSQNSKSNNNNNHKQEKWFENCTTTNKTTKTKWNEKPRKNCNENQNNVSLNFNHVIWESLFQTHTLFFWHFFWLTILFCSCFLLSLFFVREQNLRCDSFGLSFASDETTWRTWSLAVRKTKQIQKNSQNKFVKNQSQKQNTTTTESQQKQTQWQPQKRYFSDLTQK